MAYNCFQHKHQFRENAHTYFYDHTCTWDARLPKKLIHAYSKHFATQIIYMHFFAKLIHIHTWSIPATQRSYTHMSLLNLYTCIFKESLLQKKLHFMRIQVSCYSNYISIQQGFWWGIFLLSICNIHISCEVFCHLIYIYVCMMNNILKHLGVRQTNVPSFSSIS